MATKYLPSPISFHTSPFGFYSPLACFLSTSEGRAPLLCAGATITLAQTTSPALISLGLLPDLPAATLAPPSVQPPEAAGGMAGKLAELHFSSVHTPPKTAPGTAIKQQTCFSGL